MTSCLFLTIEGLTAESLAAARAAGRLTALEPLAAAGIVSELTFPLADARVATLVSTMTGTWPDQHGILLAEMADPASQTPRPAAVSDRGRAAVWEPLDAHGVACISVGWPLAITGLTERSAIVSGGFGHTTSLDFEVDPASFIHPPELVDRLADCWLCPDELDGETLAPLVPQWQRVDQEVDNRLGVLAAALAENVSRQAAFLELLDRQPWRFATLCLSLPAELTSLERASEPFADGLLDGLAERGLDLLDAFLAEIFRRLPPDSNVVVAGLPHAETPAAAGLVIASGPAFDPSRCWSRLEVPDLVPIVWGACGFGARGGLRQTIPRRDFESAWMPHPEYQPHPEDKLLHVSGKIFRSPETKLLPGEFAQYQSLVVVARSRAGRGDFLQALPYFVAITRLVPFEPNAHLQLAHCQRLLGLSTEALETTYAAVDCQFGNDPAPLLLAAEQEVLAGRPEVSRKLLAQAEPHLAAATHLRLQHAQVLVLQRDWPAASQLLEIVVRDSPLDPQVQLLLARCHLAAGEWQACFDRAIISVGLDASKARIHELLGHALLGLGMRHQAWQSFEKATLIDPAWPRPWAKIAMLARQMNKPADEIARHTDDYQKVKGQHRARSRALSDAARASLGG